MCVLAKANGDRWYCNSKWYNWFFLNNLYNKHNSNQQERSIKCESFELLYFTLKKLYKNLILKIDLKYYDGYAKYIITSISFKYTY